MYNYLNILSSQFPFIPPEAFLYQPTSKNPNIQTDQIENLVSDDYILITSKKQVKRWIFQGNTKYTKFQTQKLSEFNQYLQTKNIQLDQRWDRSWKLRFLQSTGYDHKKTITDMKIFIEYQDKNKQLKFTKAVEKCLKQGVYYLAGRDSKFRPVLVLDVKKMMSANIKQEQFRDCQTYFFQFIMRNMLIPGQVQNWNTLIDVGYEGVMSMAGHMKSSISFLQSTFRQRMFVAYIFRPSGTCSFLWSIAQKFLHQDTKRKVIFIKGQIMQQLLEYTNPTQLERKLGGTHENLTICWPPTLFSQDFTSKTVPQINLMSIEEYQEKYQKNELNNTKIYQPFAVRPKIVQNVSIKKEIVEQKKQEKKKKQQINLDELNKQITLKLKLYSEFDKLNFQQLSEVNIETQRLRPESDLSWLLMLCKKTAK